jgi:acetoin utilization protein AcuB
MKDPENMPSTDVAADVMTSYPFAVQTETILADAVAIMLQHAVRHLPVVDVTSTLVGILSDRDVRTAVGDPAAFVRDRTGSLAGYRVGDIMTRGSATVRFDTPLGELAQRLADDHLGALPVTDRFGALIGIVSYVDVLHALAPAPAAP